MLDTNINPKGMGKLMNNTEKLLKALFGDDLKMGNPKHETKWNPIDILRFPKELIDIIYEVIVHKSDYEESDGSEAYYATITFIGTSAFANFKIDRRVKVEDGDRLDPESIYLCRLKHKETGTELKKRRLYGKVIK